MVQLNVLIFRTDTGWVAQCLQYDIAAQGDTVVDAQKAFEGVLVAEVAYVYERGKTMDSISRAPQCYWDQYENAKLSIHPVPQEPSPRLPSDMVPLVNTLVPLQRELRLVG